MDLAVSIQKSKKFERTPGVFKEMNRGSHRPKKRFVLKVNSEIEAKKARKANIPILWIDSSYTKILRYPMIIPDTIIVPREYEKTIQTGLDLHTFESMTPFKDTIIPEFEDVVVFMLTLDPLAARGMVDRSELDLTYLEKRIVQENLEKEASEVYLQDHLDIPSEGSPLEKKRLSKIIDRNAVKEVLP